MHRLRYIFLLVVVAAVTAGQATAQNVKQSRDVIEAYRVCNQFKRLLSRDLDFDRAFEETFAKDPKRRREIAIVEGEFGDADLTGIDDKMLIDAFKSRMQILFSTLPLMGPENKAQEDLFFPARFKAIFDRGVPKTAAEFPPFAAQVKRDAEDMRTRLNQLASRFREVAERVRNFKRDLTEEISVPDNYLVKPLTAYSKGNILGEQEEYYQIGDYAVIREQGQMKIIGIRFFRLF